MSSRPKFTASIQINELLNIPLVTGRCWVRWYVRDSAKPDARGRTAHVPVREHRAQWDESVNIHFRLSIHSKTKVLKERVVIFDVIWDQNGTDKLTLGRVEINLAEYVNKNGSNKHGKKTKYLLKNSKINGALALSINVTQDSGPTDYIVPQMTASAVFGDITGVLKETKDGKSPNSSDILNDLHYKQFAVSWNKHDYELDPKTCIEDIFLGGNGFKKTEQESTARGSSTGNGGQESKGLGRPDMASSAGSRSGDSGGSISGNSDANLLRVPYHTGFGDEPRPVNLNARLLSEEEEREDLRSWKLREVY